MNAKWQALSLIGGQKHDDEKFRECCIREVCEELALSLDQFQVADEPDLDLVDLRAAEWVLVVRLQRHATADDVVLQLEGAGSDEPGEPHDLAALQLERDVGEDAAARQAARPEHDLADLRGNIERARARTAMSLL